MKLLRRHWVVDFVLRAAATFGDDRNGIAAVEFAILLPFMCLLYLGSYEISQAVGAQRMATIAASTVTNIVTQYASISATNDMPDILNASATVLEPYGVANARVTVTLIAIDAQGHPTVSWSKSLNGTPRTAGAAMTVPAALDLPSTHLVFGETTYVYVPLFDYLGVGTLNLYSSVYMQPRSPNGSITLTP